MSILEQMRRVILITQQLNSLREGNKLTLDGKVALFKLPRVSRVSDKEIKFKEYAGPLLIERIEETRYKIVPSSESCISAVELVVQILPPWAYVMYKDDKIDKFYTRSLTGNLKYGLPSQEVRIYPE